MELLEKTIKEIEPLDKQSMDRALVRQNSLTKPIGSLGRLEDLSIKVAGIQRNALPVIEHKAILTFAGDHHVVYEE